MSEDVGSERCRPGGQSRKYLTDEALFPEVSGFIGFDARIVEDRCGLFEWPVGARLDRSRQRFRSVAGILKISKNRFQRWKLARVHVDQPTNLRDAALTRLAGLGSAKVDVVQEPPIGGVIW